MFEAVLVMLALGGSCGLILGLASKIFYVYEDPRISEVESLLAGATHTSVYRWLEKKKKELERNRMFGADKVELKESFQGDDI